MKTALSIFLVAALGAFGYLFTRIGYDSAVADIGGGKLKPEILTTTNFVYKAVSALERP